MFGLLVCKSHCLANGAPTSCSMASRSTVSPSCRFWCCAEWSTGGIPRGIRRRGLTLRSSGPHRQDPLSSNVRTTNKKLKQETYMRRNILIYTIIAALFLIAYSFNRVQNNNICAQQQTNYLNDISKPFIEKNQEKYRLWQSTIGKSHQSDHPRTWLGASHQFSSTIQQYRSLGKPCTTPSVVC